MRRFAACLVATALPALVPSTVAVANHSSKGLRARTPVVGAPDRGVIDRLVFAVPLAQFRSERSRAKRLHRWLITATDGCTAPLVGSRGASFDFRLACERHDLAYANYAALSRLSLGVEWDSALRARVDDQFQRDMQASCARRRHTERLRCDAWVMVFFHTVRVAAGP